MSFSTQGYDSIREKSLCPLLICRNSKQLCFLIVLLCMCGSKAILNSKQLRLGSELPEKCLFIYLFITLFTSRHNLTSSEATGVRQKNINSVILGGRFISLSAHSAFIILTQDNLA